MAIWPPVIGRALGGMNEGGALQAMLERFAGTDGKRRLIKVLADQKLVQHNEAIARKLADLVKVEEFPETKQLYVRGEPGKNVLFLVLSGRIDLFVEDKPVRTLEAGQFVGEFPILNSSLDYTVSVVASEKCVVASLSEPQLLSLVSDHPEIWRNMAKELAIRLRIASITRQPAAAAKALTELTVAELIGGLKPVQLWGVFAALAALVAGAFTLGGKLFGGP